MKVGPKYKICRRLGSSVFEKCQGQKFQLSESKRRPQRRRRRRSNSDYGVQLLEKQKVRFTYGLKEHQFRSYVNEATEKDGVPTENLYSLLERRLDNVVFKLGFANTRRFARQLVSHGHITVNGRKLNVPSHLVREDDVITLREGTEKKNFFDALRERVSEAGVPNWLTLDKKALTGTVSGSPKPDEGESAYDLSAVVQFYSR